MKKLLLGVGAALAIAAVPVAVGAQGFGQNLGDQTRLRVHSQAQTSLQTRDQDQTRLQLQDGSGDRHVNCDGTPGDQHQYRGAD